MAGGHSHGKNRGITTTGNRPSGTPTTFSGEVTHCKSTLFPGIVPMKVLQQILAEVIVMLEPKKIL